MPPTPYITELCWFFEFLRAYSNRKRITIEETILKIKGQEDCIPFFLKCIVWKGMTRKRVKEIFIVAFDTNKPIVKVWWDSIE